MERSLLENQLGLLKPRFNFQQCSGSIGSAYFSSTNKSSIEVLLLAKAQYAVVVMWIHSNELIVIINGRRACRRAARFHVGTGNDADGVEPLLMARRY